MSLDDKPEDDPEDVPWNPDDEKLERRYLRRMVEMMERAIERENRSDRLQSEYDSKLYEVQKETAMSTIRGIAGQLPSPHSPDGTSPLIVVRPIENGFILSFLEVLEVGPNAAHSIPADIAEKLGSDVAKVRPILSVRRVEAFFVSPGEVVPYMERATKSLRELGRAAI